jgi:TRAP-type C4-dicarboxylate transport system substrate-binding protein
VMDAKFYEVTKQIVLTSHLVDLNYLTISKKAWDSLSPENQAKLQKAADEACEFGRQNQLAKEAELVEGLKAKGPRSMSPISPPSATRCRRPIWARNSPRPGLKASLTRSTRWQSSSI